MLPRKKRVTTELFKKILLKGRSVHTTSFSLRFFGETTLFPSRFSVSVSKKVLKKAAERNRLKRRINGALEKLYPSIKESYVGVISPKSPLAKLSYIELRKNLEEVLQRANLLG